MTLIDAQHSEFHPGSRSLSKSASRSEEGEEQISYVIFAAQDLNSCAAYI